MNKKLENKILGLTLTLKKRAKENNKHFTFLVHKNKVVAIGWNTKKTHPIANKAKYRFNATHSELAAYLRFQDRKKYLVNCILINTRINSLNKIGYSKPCENCLSWINKVGFKKIYYTDFDGKFKRLK